METEKRTETGRDIIPCCSVANTEVPLAAKSRLIYLTLFLCHVQLSEMTMNFLLLDEAIASKAVFVIVSGSDGRAGETL